MQRLYVKENASLRAWPRSWHKHRASVVYNFLAIWLVYSPNERFWLATTARNSYHKYSELTLSWTFIREKTTSTVHLLQTFKHNYHHFTIKHTRLQWHSHGRSYLERPKHWGLKKKGISWHIDASSVVWTLIYNGKLANEIARLVAIVEKNVIHLLITERSKP